MTFPIRVAGQWMAEMNGYGNGGGSPLFAAVPCVFALIGFGLFALWLWALIDAIRNPQLDQNQRLIWVLVVVFTAPIGPILYLLIGRKS